MPSMERTCSPSTHVKLSSLLPRRTAGSTALRPLRGSRGPAPSRRSRIAVPHGARPMPDSGFRFARTAPSLRAALPDWSGDGYFRPDIARPGIRQSPVPNCRPRACHYITVDTAGGQTVGWMAAVGVRNSRQNLEKRASEGCAESFKNRICQTVHAAVASLGGRVDVRLDVAVYTSAERSGNSLESSLAWVDGLCAAFWRTGQDSRQLAEKQGIFTKFSDWIPLDSRHPAHSLTTCGVYCGIVTGPGPDPAPRRNVSAPG